MCILYLVVMVAAMTKYSINSLKSPAPDVDFSGSKNRAKGRHDDLPLIGTTP
jgi:hypothetical protein